MKKGIYKIIINLFCNKYFKRFCSKDWVQDRSTLGVNVDFCTAVTKRMRKGRSCAWSLFFAVCVIAVGIPAVDATIRDRTLSQPIAALDSQLQDFFKSPVATALWAFESQSSRLLPFIKEALNNKEAQKLKSTARLFVATSTISEYHSMLSSAIECRYAALPDLTESEAGFLIFFVSKYRSISFGLESLEKSLSATADQKIPVDEPYKLEATWTTKNDTCDERSPKTSPIAFVKGKATELASMYCRLAQSLCKNEKVKRLSEQISEIRSKEKSSYTEDDKRTLDLLDEIAKNHDLTKIEADSCSI